MVERLESIISAYESGLQLCKFVTKLGNAKNNLFTFLLHPGVPPTNNAAEQGVTRISDSQEDSRTGAKRKGDEDVRESDDVYHDMEFTRMQYSR